MKKKALILTALILAVALIGGIWWYTNKPVPVEEPAEPAESESGEIAVNSGPEESTPETEGDSEPEKNVPESTPEKEGDAWSGDVRYNKETGEIEPVYGTGSLADEYGLDGMTDEEVAEFVANIGSDFDEWLAEQNAQYEAEEQGTGEGQGQAQSQGTEQQRTWEEIQQKLKEAGHNVGKIEEGGGSHTENRPTINW